MNTESRKIDIKSLSYVQLVDWLSKIREKSFRANQIFKWIYQHQYDDFDNMNNINKNLKKNLKKTFCIPRLKIKSILKSSGGSKKYAFRLLDGNIIESLLIPEKNHFTLCVSSQVGCAQKCSFCMTGRCGFTRNLSSDEIIGQIRDIQKEVKNNGEKIPLSNIVFMGIGEPLANYAQVLKALKIVSNGSYGLKISPRHTTISTAGLIPQIKLIGSETKVNIAISLNAADNETRNLLMPINKIYPLKELIETCRTYPLSKRQKITFEYVMIRGINDSKSDAMNLSKLLKNIKAKINLIPLNEHTKCKYKRSHFCNILKFQKYLIEKNYTVTIRHSKGEDIAGACGQLRARQNLK